ncbi:MAG: proton-dependent oligopeptide transporter, family [Acidobacteriota bacterium]|jgi:POT family proton-dependent oligopeptide transporter|nr:proton-dependent oligopeptide transporter, family [Acidobacteriota bacterium]
MNATAEKQWLGHPRGLATLYFTEMWERFSYYGMRALLILYMVGSVQQPGLGFGERKAAQIYGLYTMLVYLSGIPGGWLADRVLGHYRAVLIGGIIISAGHFSMAVPGLPFFYLGLGLIIIGTGLLKPNVSTMVGSLYRRDDVRRDSGFSLFYMGINLGAFIAPIICGWLGQKWNWHFGFAAAGFGMIIGLIQYVAGRKYLTPVSDEETPGTKAVETVQEVVTAPPPARKLTGTDWARIGAISILTLFALLFWAGFEQAGSSLTLFADRATRLTVFNFSYPSSWFQSVEPLFVLIFSPVFALIWLRMGSKQPSSPAKFTLALFFLSLSFALIIPAARAYQATGTRVSLMWLVGLYFLQMVGELCLSPVGLSMVTKLAPKHLVGLMMGVWFFATAMGNYVAGWVAGFLQDRPFTDVFQAAVINLVIATVVLALLIKPIKKMMHGVN